jgi:hypothetical protein
MSRIYVPGGPDPEPEPDYVTRELTPEMVRAWLEGAIEANRRVARTSPSQRHLDRTIETALAEGELYLAAGLLLVHSARVRRMEGQALQVLIQMMIDAGPVHQVCRVCGCTDDDGCPEGCVWVEIDLCSACQGKAVPR